MNWNKCWTAGCVAAASGLLLVSCAPKGSGGEAGKEEAPLSDVTDAQAHSDARIKAIRRTNEAVAANEVQAGPARESLKRVAWSRSTYWKVRAAAIEELLEDGANEADTRNMLRLMLPTESQSQIVDLVCEKAAAGRWTEAAPALVRRWSKPDSRVADEKRPERAALAAIYPDVPVEQTVFRVFSGENQAPSAPDSASAERTRDDAWALLRRIDTSGRTRDLLVASSAGADPVIGTLQRAARDFKAVPETAEQLAWVRRLGEPENAGFWARVTDAVAKLSEEQAKGLAIRHGAIVAWAGENRSEWLSMSREQLLREVEGRLKDRPRHWRNAAGTSGSKGEGLHRWRDSLAWGDALTILVADEAMKGEGVAAELFTHAKADQSDTSTEYGGNIVFDSVRFAAPCFPPRATQRYDDRRFVPSEDMLKAGDTALFHYHFHATAWNNSDYAGPSQGDIDAAKSLGRASLLFTAIDERTLGVDYYQADGATIDLGVLKGAAK